MHYFTLNVIYTYHCTRKFSLKNTILESDLKDRYVTFNDNDNMPCDALPIYKFRDVVDIHEMKVKWFYSGREAADGGIGVGIIVVVEVGSYIDRTE